MSVNREHQHDDGSRKSNRKPGDRGGTPGEMGGPTSVEGTPSGAFSEQNQAAVESGSIDSGAKFPSVAMVFSFNDRPFRPVQMGTETWFVASDVCGALEYANSRDAISKLDDDEKGVANLNTLGGKQQMNVVSESSLYSLAFKSEKPQAKAFRRWVTGVALPEIRRTGRYDLNPDQPKVAQAKDDGPGWYEWDRDVAFQRIAVTECQTLAQALKTVDAFWRLRQQYAAVGIGRQNGFLATQLEDVIVEGARLANHYLHAFEAGEESGVSRAPGQGPQDQSAPSNGAGNGQ